MHGSLIVTTQKKRACNCIIILHKHHDDIHGQSGIVQTVADVLSFNKENQVMCGERDTCV